MDFQLIMNEIKSGATLTVRPHDALNPGHGFIAKIEGPHGFISTSASAIEVAIDRLESRLENLKTL